MAVTQVSICNLALIEIGADTISSIEESTKSARLLKALWSLSVDQVLHDHRWKFAETRVTLSPISSSPEFEYDNAFDLPSDCIKPWELYSASGAEPEWKREGNQILSNEATLDLIYVYRHTDYAVWPPTFAEALGLKLSAQVSYALTQSLALRESLERKYLNKLALARSFSGTEGVQKSLIADEWTNARK